MAFITRDSGGADDTAVPSFMTAVDDDPFASGVAGAQSSLACPDAKRNLLDDLNLAENTLLPAPGDKESVAVFLRVKPRTDRELALIREISGAEKVDTVIPEEVVKVETEHQVALIAPRESQAYRNCANGMGTMTHRYTFSKIFPPSCNQRDIFSGVVQPRVKDFIEGQNQLLFTYGATSAGKTFTIQGVPGNSGIMPRAIDTIFNTIGDRLSANLPLQPLGFNRVVAVGAADLESLQREKESVYRLGLELRSSGRNSPDLSTMSGVSQASTASSASTATGDKEALDLTKLAQYFPGLANRDRDDTVIEVRHENISYSVWISFAEIYNENIHDLLRKVPLTKKARPCMKLCDDRVGNTYVKGLREIRVNSADEAYQALMIGRENLHFAATKLNQQSSRSHCIFTVKVVKVADPSSPHLARVSMLSFCDLAGSERISKTHNVGERAKEAGNINTSLLVLGRCIKGIRHNQVVKDKKNIQVVPYRESKLTRLFKSFFTGLGRSSLIVCISQAQYLFDETVHVCKFASIASKVTVETREPAPKAKKKKASRFSTMVAASGRSRFLSVGGNTLAAAQQTMAWEAPPRKSSLLPTFAAFAPNARSTMVPLPVMNETELDCTSAADMTDVLDNTVVQTQYEALLGLVEELKQKLVAERQKNSVLERDLREELCEEFNQMLVEVEGNWENRLREEKEEVEKISEWRLGEIQKVHMNKNKRKREAEDDLGTEIDSFRLQARLEASEKAVEEGQQELEAMRETSLRAGDAQKNLQTANSKIQFELAEQRRLAEEQGRELVALRSRLQGEGGEGEALTCVREELRSREEEVTDLKELLQEAGDEFMAKDEELKGMQEQVAVSEAMSTRLQLSQADVQTQLEESHLLLEEANNRLEEKEARLDELEPELEGEKECVAQLRRRLGELEGEVRVVTEKCGVVEGYNGELKRSLDQEQEKVQEASMTAKEAEEKMLAAQGELGRLLKEKASLVALLAGLKEGGAGCSSVQSGVEVLELRQQVEVLEGACEVLKGKNEEARKEVEVLQVKVEELQCKVEELKTCTSVDDSMIEEEEKEKMKAEVEMAKEEKAELVTQLSNAELHVVQVKEELESAKKAVENADFELAEKVAEIEALKEESVTKVSELEESARKLEKQIAETAENSENSVIDIKNQLQKSVSAKEMLEEETKKLQAIVTEVKENMSRSEEEVVKLKKAESEAVKDIETKTAELSEVSEKLKSAKEAEAELRAEMKSIQEGNKAALVEQEVKILQRSKSSTNHRLVELEVRSDSLEKELVTKDHYVKELEDIIVEKEATICELEAKQKEDEEAKLRADKEVQKAEETLKSVKDELEEVNSRLAHQEDVKKQRENLERKTAELQESSKHLESLEEELETFKKEKKKAEDGLKVATEKIVQVKAELEESRGEVKMLNLATKKCAKEALKETQELEEVRGRSQELEREVARLRPLTEAHRREEAALEVLRSELSSKSAEIAILSEKLELHDAESRAKDYELTKTKDDRDRLMSHYEAKFKQAQAELATEKDRKNEVGKLQEAMARATPTKQTGELKERLRREEERVAELRVELGQLQRQLDTRTAEHEREINRVKLASQQVVDDFKSTNKELQRNWDVSQGVSSANCSATEGSTLEADDSKTDNSFLEVTPIVKKTTKGRGRGRATKLGNRTTSNASLASYEDTENEELPARPRANTLTRRGRVTRRSKTSLTEEEQEGELEEQGKGGNKRRAADVLKERQVLQLGLSPVVEDRASKGSTSSTGSTGNLGNFRDSDSAAFLTPAIKKKRKLYTTTPQHSEVFTPPTPNSNHSTPGSVVKRQLRARKSSKR